MGIGTKDRCGCLYDMRSIMLRLPFAFLLTLLATVYVDGQTAPLEKYHFEDGGFTFVGIFSHYNDHPLQKKLGEFYTTDLAVLNALKKSWRFTRPQHDYACGYHYEFLVLRNGATLDSFVVNLECNQLRTSGRSLFFDSRKLEVFATRFAPLRREKREFRTIAEARAYLNTAESSPTFVYAQPPRWIEFEGEFDFRMKCPTTDKACYREFAKYKPALEKEISAKYPGEKFMLEPSGSSNDELFIRVRSKKSLEERFDLYDRWSGEYFGAWHAYPPTLVLYFAVPPLPQK